MPHAARARPALSASALLLLDALRSCRRRPRRRAEAAPAPAPAKMPRDEPPFHEYKGVKIGMTADEARKNLGNPTDKGDKQDYYALNDRETARSTTTTPRRSTPSRLRTFSGKAVPSPRTSSA